MKYVIRFSKKDKMVYISHLDLQRLMLRVLRIAGVQPAYSNGFNPHPKVSIALPLSLGFLSGSEFLEIETHAPIDTGQVMSAMNNVLHDGIKISSIEEKDPAFAGTLASRAAFALYEIVTDNGPGMSDSMPAFLGNKAIFVEKYNRKTGETVKRDIRPQIASFEIVTVFNGRIRLNCLLDCRSGSTLNPLTLLSAYCDFCGAEFTPEHTSVIRKAINFR